MAGDFSKPDKVHTLFPDEIPGKMWPLPVSELFFVGQATTSKLHRLGIYTIGDLARADDAVIKSHLKLPGQIVQGYARGKDLEPYMFGHEKNKGYGNSLTAPWISRVQNMQTTCYYLCVRQWGQGCGMTM